MTIYRIYPVLVRPSYVLGGAGMEICLNDGDVKKFMKIINRQYQEHPILIDKYLAGKEVEVDAICDENGILIPGIMEHVERAGVHSGDSISVYPTQKIKQHIKDTIVEYTGRLAKALAVPDYVNEIADLGITHVTITANAIDPEIAKHVYSMVRYDGNIYKGIDGARILLERQSESIRKLKEKNIIVKINTVATAVIKSLLLPPKRLFTLSMELWSKM